MLWTCKQVFEVERLYVRQMVSRTQAQYGTDYFDMVCDRMAHDLINYAHPLGVELNQLDIHVARHEEPMFDSTMLTASWRPETREGVLLGGPADGKRVTVPPAAHRWQFRVAVMQGTEGWTPGTAFPTAVEVDTLGYQWSGWDETNRIWTYQAP